MRSITPIYVRIYANRVRKSSTDITHIRVRKNICDSTVTPARKYGVRVPSLRDIQKYPTWLEP
ncbi:MAG: hypothetical protein QGG09_00580, partial [Pirellulaceae bacterium]|nr:hypothetical protein [Pirellulaceae bacterium]